MESLEFERPVTLIVGHNGAGKTTIIECLKMATCGQLPPNCDKGHGFIHDPNVAGVPEVKGQIRLLFRTGVNHQHVCATRTFQLSNTRAKNGVVKSQFKALENMLRVKDKDGDDNRFSRRCADMDAIIPQLMGVSRAILEHVVFCHQEESNWPLGERIVLKKRFDEIFGSSRYTKALEAIDKKRKETAKDAKEKSHVLDLIRKDRDLALSLTQEKNRLRVSIDSISNRIIQTSQEISQNERKLSELEKIESESRSHLNEIDRLCAQKKLIESALIACNCSIDTISQSVQQDHAELMREASVLTESRPILQTQINQSRIEFQDCLNRRNDITNRIKTIRASMSETSNISDLIRIKQTEFLQILEPFENSHEKLTFMLDQSKSDKDQFVSDQNLIQTEKVSCLRSLETALVNLNHEKFSLESELANLSKRAESLCNELNVVINPQIGLVVLPGTDETVIESVATQFFSDKLCGIDAETDRVVMERRLLTSKSNSGILIDFKSQVLDEIPTVVRGSSKTDDPLIVLAKLESEKTQILSDTENTDPGDVPEEVVRINDSINNAKAAQKIYTSLGAKSVTDSKCHFCRRVLDNVAEFESGINKYVTKLNSVVPELEAKKNGISTKSSCGRNHERIEKLLQLEHAIAKIKTFIHVADMIDCRVSGGDGDADRVAELEQKESALAKEKNQLMFDRERFFSLIEKRKELMKQLSECQSGMELISNEKLVNVSERIRECGNMLENCKTDLTDFVSLMRNRITEFDSKINSLNTTNHLVVQMRKQLEELKRKASSESVGEHGQLGQLETEESELSSRCSDLMKKLQGQEAEIVELDNRVSAIQTRVSISEKQVELIEISSQIERIKSVIGSRTFDPEQLRAEIKSVSQSVQMLREERSRMEGESGQVGNQVRELESKLASFFDIDERFRQAMIQFETESLVAKDIARYHQALDRALMNYHVSKMNEINAVIRELWERVYKGTDIDFIAIRSDTEGEEEGGGVVTAKRSYNYRVVMVKGDVELEMRGRCSAGQKVLSCLIIRLALAESFCVNCGILSLDEPTTNLDRANIGGLAEALAELIESRRNQRNFQLIIITHDESFVRMLGRLHACENFYRVRKDDYGHSTISRSAIYELNATA